MPYKNLDTSLSHSATFVTKQLSDQCVTMLCGWVDGSSWIYNPVTRNTCASVTAGSGPLKYRCVDFVDYLAFLPVQNLVVQALL